MRFISSIGSVVTTLALSTILLAMPAKASNEANIDAGNVQIGGAGSVTWAEYAPALWQVNALAEYFIVDHLSIGGTVNGTSQGSASSFNIGPSLTWDILQVGRLVPFVGVGVNYATATNLGTSSGTTNGWSLDGKVGVNYFFTPSVAFGPEYLYTNYAATGGQSGSNNSSAVLLQFSMFL